VDYVSYIEIMILRHLTRRPAHGYELRKRVERTVGVRLNNNSLYPALKRFEDAGAVTRTEQSQAGKPARNVYALTATGRDMLHDMLADLPPEQAGDDNEFLARLGQFSLLSPDERLSVLDARHEAVTKRYAHFVAMHELSDAERWASAVTGELARRAAGELDWLAELRKAAEIPDGA
jgi:DNA-binding PadR family transcriptional regulator